MRHKGHYGEYTGNAKWSRNHADTKVTKSNYKASERDDAAHIDYLKRDVDYDNKHGHSDENMTADEKHISKLAGDMKYDKKHHSPAKNKVEGLSHDELQDRSAKGFERHMEIHNSPAKTTASSGRSGHPRHMQAGADNSGNPNAASPDEYWRKHQQLRHHQSAPTKMTSPAKKSKAVYVGGTVNYQSGDTTREFGTSGKNRRSVEIKSNVYGDGQATKTVHKLNKKTNEVESKTRNISNKRASRIEDRKYKRFRKAGAQGVNDTLSTVRG